jgi:molecular chaperone GrpE
MTQPNEAANAASEETLEAQETAEQTAETVQEISEADMYKDKYLRTVAELENVRKRTEKELSDARKYAVTNFARELLSVQDNADRARTACKAENADVATIATGVDMMLGQFESLFEKFQIERVEAVGQPLNPDLHQVMQEEETTDAEAGTVLQELQAGYTIAGRLLRPALVITAKEPAN